METTRKPVHFFDNQGNLLFAMDDPEHTDKDSCGLIPRETSFRPGEVRNVHAVLHSKDGSVPLDEGRLVIKPVEASVYIDGRLINGSTENFSYLGGPGGGSANTITFDERGETGLRFRRGRMDPHRRNVIVEFFG